MPHNRWQGRGAGAASGASKQASHKKTKECKKRKAVKAQKWVAKMNKCHRGGGAWILLGLDSDSDSCQGQSSEGESAASDPPRCDAFESDLVDAVNDDAREEHRKKVQGANAPQLSSLLQHGDLLQQISAHLCHTDIARLCMSCTVVSFWTNTLYKTVCDGLGFNQTGSRSRPLPYSLIFRQHLCTECCRPAVSDNSVHIDLNGGCRSATRWPANDAVKWLCGECRRELKASRDKSSSLQHTARRFGDAVRREMLEILR